MRIKRSEHVSISVDRKQFDQAVQFYTTLFGMREIKREESLVGLKGENFTLWITTEKPGVIYQEWVAEDPSKALEKFLEAGCKLDEGNGKTDSGHGHFMVDPFGLRFHLYTSPGEFLDKMFP